MRELLPNILRWILKKLAQVVIWRYRPGIVGVTGNSGKTSAKLAITAVLSGMRKVRASKGNFNNELGLPLAIIGDWSEKKLKLVGSSQPADTEKMAKLFFWLKVILTGVWKIIFKDKNYPEILVLEYGADRPGDIRKLLEIARPNISVITSVGEIPVHVEFFSGPEEVAREKARLIEYLPSAGFAILNYDDASVINLKEKTRAHVIAFGFQQGAEIRILNFENRIKDGKPAGVSFKLEYGGSIVPVFLDNVFGKVQAYAASAAFAVGLIFGMNLIIIAEALKSYRPAEGRMDLLPGIKSSLIIDSSYNASPSSVHAALDTLRILPAKRKIAVLGDMLEIGKYTEEAHRRAGRLVAQFVDILVTVGPRAKFIADEAKKKNLPGRNIFSFDEVSETIKKTQKLVKKGDLILAKGSHAMRLQELVEALKDKTGPIV